MLKEAHPDVFQLSVSHTTRGPRPGEKNETDYYFTTMENFEKLIAENGFVEHAKFGGNRYGTSKMALEKMRAEGKVAVLDIEMEVRYTQNIALTMYKNIKSNSYIGCQTNQGRRPGRPLRVHRPSLLLGSRGSSQGQRH